MPPGAAQPTADDSLDESSGAADMGADAAQGQLCLLRMPRVPAVMGLHPASVLIPRIVRNVRMRRRRAGATSSANIATMRRLTHSTLNSRAAASANAGSFGAGVCSAVHYAEYVSFSLLAA
jgi:hypothetical protein